MEPSTWIELGLLTLSLVVNICQHYKKRKLQKITEAVIEGVESYSKQPLRENDDVKGTIRSFAESFGVQGPLHKIVQAVTEEE